jgi:hypothetical protein
VISAVCKPQTTVYPLVYPLFINVASTISLLSQQYIREEDEEEETTEAIWAFYIIRHLHQRLASEIFCS